MEQIQLVVSGFQIGASIAVAIALGFTIKAFYKVRKTEQLKLGADFHRDMIKLEEELGGLLQNDQVKLENWDSRTFNSLEWNAFLINQKEITNKDLINYFAEYFVKYYDDVFMVLAPEELKTNPKKYPEFKTVVKDIKARKYIKRKYTVFTLTRIRR